MSKLDLAKWSLAFPAATLWVDLLTKSPIWEAMKKVVWSVDWILNVWNSLTNPLFAPLGISLSWVAWWVSAWMLSNSILNDLWIEKKWIKYTANTAATLAWFAWWPLSAPFLLAWASSYYLWKYWWKYWKEAVKRIWWAAWWLTWWLVKWAVVWWYKSVKAWIKWEQKINPVI